MSVMPKADGPMFQRILVPISHADYSQRAVAVAAEIGRRFNAHILVIHVQESMALDAFVLGPFPPGFREKAAREDEELVAMTVDQLRRAGVEARGDVLPERHAIPREIVEAAHAYRADLIVMGTRGLSPLLGLLIGSVAYRVVHRADRPVVIVR